MEPRRRHLAIAGVFGILLALHVWLLWRAASRGDIAISVLLAVAMAVFLHRIPHHLRASRGGTAAGPAPALQRRRIRIWSIVLVLLLPVHGWLLSQTLASGDTLLTALLIVAVAAMVYRLAFYARRYAALRRTG